MVQIWWGHHDNFCVWKKLAITFGEGCISINNTFSYVKLIYTIRQDLTISLPGSDENTWRTSACWGIIWSRDVSRGAAFNSTGCEASDSMVPPRLV